ncbi:hypothetical protein [Eubacterium oxidoreducens]|uniref:Uncharacterized protein n=1 Tax=Eubacterium oxidoreducens TaxID=1732 RepID=A0A1G6B3I2_EUBOX|nr:hypothetical protein [Eubacterium oxidoreducens]SDB15231.1 hypothetical protein SAMN02910417_01128 [Eubacterium oxidoreducens]
MDLGAYAQIEKIEKIAKANDIEVPRLRGYRLMKDEEKVNYIDLFDGIDITCVEDLCESVPFWSTKPYYWVSSSYTDYPKRFFWNIKITNP